VFSFSSSQESAFDVLMHLMVHHAAEDGLIHFVAFMLAFVALRKLSHALESRL
jgi:hypothetical protein